MTAKRYLNADEILASLETGYGMDLDIALEEFEFAPEAQETTEEEDAHVLERFTGSKNTVNWWEIFDGSRR